LRSPFKLAATEEPEEYDDGYWYLLHLHYNGEGRYPGTITHCKLIKALSGSFNYAKENAMYPLGVAIKDPEDYARMKQAAGNWSDPNYFIEDWQHDFGQLLQDTLWNWVKKQNRPIPPNGRMQNVERYTFKDVWESYELLSKYEYVQCGPALVRNRSRCLITEEKLPNDIETILFGSKKS
jgi:hypothetical protein